MSDLQEIPISERILDDRALVKGVLYCIEHIESGKQYVGQTVTHRLNKGKFRPYGARRRFAEHCSNALCNTKSAQSPCLYNAIRQYGPEAFTFHELEVCDLEVLDDRERYWIDQQGSSYPNGFNLTTGGHRGFHMLGSVPVPPRNTARPRGGSNYRSEETRARMSVSAKVAAGKQESRAKRSSDAMLQHTADKAARFTGVTVDPTNLDQYIARRKGMALVSVDGKKARFASKYESPDTLVARAKAFLMTLCPSQSDDTIQHIQDGSDSVMKYTATLPNCSGNP